MSLAAVPDRRRYVAPARSIYVASASNEMERARRAMAAVRALGFTVPCDWTQVIDGVGQANPLDATTEQCRAWAAADLDGIREASIFWLLYPAHRPSHGAFFEYGVAWLWSLRTIVSGENAAGLIFSALADVRVEDDDAALAWLAAMGAQS